MDKLTLSVVLGASLASGFRTVFSQARGEVSTIGVELKRTERLAGQIGQHIALESGAERARVKLMEARKATEALRLQHTLAQGEGHKAAAKVEQQWNAAKQKTLELERALERERSKLSEVGDTLRKAGIDTKNLSAENERLGAVIRDQTKAYETQQNLLKSRAQAKDTLRGELVKLGATVAYVKTATSTAIEFESAMADVKKVVDFDTPDQFKSMGQDIQRLAGRLPMTAEGIAKIVAAGGQAGFARQELLRFAEDASKMGVAFDTTADEAGQMMAQWRTAFKLPQDGVVALADKINYLGNTGPATALKISDIVTRIGPLGDVAGVASGEIAALGSTVAGMGIAPEIAATGIKNLMLGLTAGESATKSQREAFDALGLSAEKMAKAMQKDAAGTITLVLSKLRQLPKEKQAAALDGLFGKESIGAIAPLLTNLEKLQENFAKVGNASRYAGSMEAEYQSRAATTANSLQLLKNNFARLGNIIGSVFLPPLNMVVSGLQWVLGGLADLADRFPLVTAVVVGATTAWLGWKTAVAATQLALTYLPGLVGSVTSALAVVPKVLGMATAALGPIGWGVIAIGAAIAGAAMLVYKYWQPIQAFFTGFFQGLWQGLAPLRTIFAEAFAPLAPMFSAIGNAVAQLFSWFAQLLTPVQSSSAELARATEAGATFGKIVAGAIQIVTLPLTALVKLVGVVISGWSQIFDLVGKGMKAQGIGSSVAAPATASSAPTAPTARRQAAAAVVASAVATSPMATAAAAPTVTHTNSYQVAIHAAPGMNEQQLAREVSRQLDQRDRERAARSRSTMHDRD